MLWHCENVLSSCCIMDFDIVLCHCGNVCVLEDFLVFLLSFVCLFGLECEYDHECEGFTHPCGKGREVQGEGHKLRLHD